MRRWNNEGEMARKTAASIAPKQKLLEEMRANPKGDWKIQDIETVCVRLGIDFEHGGRHAIASSHLLSGHQAIPSKRPIKAIYVRFFVAMCDAHLAELEKAKP